MSVSERRYLVKDSHEHEMIDDEELRDKLGDVLGNLPNDIDIYLFTKKKAEDIFSQAVRVLKQHLPYSKILLIHIGSKKKNDADFIDQKCIIKSH